MSPVRHELGPVSSEIRASADRALEQAFAMHEAAVVLAAAEAFDIWAAEHPGMYGRTDVVGFLMRYGRSIVEPTLSAESPAHD
jgi:hypothetical protein